MNNRLRRSACLRSFFSFAAGWIKGAEGLEARIGYPRSKEQISGIAANK